ncbi:MAG: complex I 51 kDa subunit family protein [Leptospirales bacterium]
MTIMEGPDRVLTDPALMGDPSLASYEKGGGYKGLRRVLSALSPTDVIAEIKESGLRGRGGSGFPTALKWEKVAHHRVPVRYVVANGSEGEPGSHKDHYLISRSPHQILEGMIIACFAVSARSGHLFVKESFPEGVAILKRAREEALRAGLLGNNILGTGFSVDIEIFVGPAAYIAGEETALLEALEGRMPRPRPKPPFYPTEMGLHRKPTVVNNVETYAHVSRIMANGPAWFRERGTQKSPGTMIFSVSGSVRRPVVVELPLGFSLERLLYDYAGGPLPGESFQCFFTGGPSFGILPAREIDTPLEYDALRAKGTGLGSAGIIVLGSGDSILATASAFAAFYEKGSCGQCPPCRLGTESLHDLLERIEGGSGSEETLERIAKVAKMIKGRGNCGLITASAFMVESLLDHFAPVLREEIASHGERRPRRIPSWQYDHFVPQEQASAHE